MTDPSYIRDFKAFTKGPLRFVDLKRLDGELYGENDRALGVLRASLLEAALETYLMSYVRPSFNADLTRRLFEFSGILGPFGAKITIAYAFNWIGPETRHDLELIRQIRNEFAHCRKALAFTDAPVAAVCRHLKSPDWPGAQSPYGSLTRAVKPEQKDNSHPRTRYVRACFTLSSRFLQNVRQHGSPDLQ